VTAGADLCPPPGADELATLKRIRAEPDIRLACQLRPQKDISVIPLVRTDRPVYRPTAPEVDAEREVVLLFCDFTNRVALERQHLAHDVLFVFTRYAESACSAIAGAGGTISYVAHDSICALFGTSGSLQRAARQALAATIAVEHALAEINVGLDQRWGCKADVVVTVHAGRAAMSHIGRDVDTIMAGGHAVDAANELRARAAEADKAFAVSNAVFAAAEMPPPAEAATVIPLASEPKLSAYLSDTAPGNTGAPRAWWRENLAGATDLIKTIVSG
jgi:adenylate cyclase